MPHDPTEHPTYPPAWWAGHPIVRYAENALRAFGGELDRETAAALLPMWRHAGELTERERDAVLQRFGPAGDNGWSSGSMGTS